MIQIAKKTSNYFQFYMASQKLIYVVGRKIKLQH